MNSEKVQAFIGLILMIVAAIAPVQDLNKIVFGIGLGISFKYAVRWFTILLIRFTIRTSKPANNERS